MDIDPDKYVVFNREALYQLMGELALPPWKEDDGTLIGQAVNCAPIAEHIIQRVTETELHDAVVLRKSDKLASGAIHSYATACWTTADVLIEVDRDDEAADLIAVGDYFMAEYEDARRIQDHLPTP